MNEIMRPGDAPREIDCPCGERHIVDPRAAEKVMRKRRFVCTSCGHRYRTDMVAAFDMNDHGSGDPICLRCAFGHLTELVEELRS